MGFQTHAPRELVEEGILQCAEYYSPFLSKSKDGHIGVISLYKKNRAKRQYIPIKEFSESRCTNYYITIEDPEIISWATKPFHRISKVTIKTIDRNETLAEAKEQLWDGGLIGLYRHLYAERKSGEFLACGYVSNKPHWWRKAKNIYDEYSEADKKFILSVLNPD